MASRVVALGGKHQARRESKKTCQVFETWQVSFFVAGKAIKNSPSPDNQARGCTIEAALYHLINRTSKVPSLKITVSGKSCPKSCDNNLKATEKVPLAVLATVSTVTSTKLAGLS